MKKISLLLPLCILLCACHAAPSAPDLAAEDFMAQIVFTLGESEYAAMYTKSGTEKTVVFSAPETIAGLTVCAAADGSNTVTVGDLTFPAVAAEYILTFTKLFAPPEGCLRFHSETGGIRCFFGEDGANRYTVYTDQNGLPTRLCGAVDGREYDIQILRYERRDRP